MARTVRKAPDDDGEIKTKDFAGAVRALKEDILPAQSKVGEHAQEMSTAYKHIKKNCHIQPAAARMAFRPADMEAAKREDFLRSFNGLIAELDIGLPADLVDMAEGTKAGPPPVQSGRSRPKLVTLPSDGRETDLAGEDDADAPAPGTGAAALAAMNAKARGGNGPLV